MGLLDTARQHYGASDPEKATAAALIAIGQALTPDPRAAALLEEVKATRFELARGDAKAAVGLALAGTAFTVLVAVGALAHPPVLVRVGLWLATTALGVSCSILLWAIAPRIPRRGGTGFVAYARVTSAAELLSTLTMGDLQDRLSEEVHRLSRIALKKYKRVGWGLWSMQAALLIIVVTLLGGLT
ncbi:Pycsar system effector family protein [Streptosporangium saharense]|uniref:Pycsar effector protein domain-containing protein n=1 Tax=Streptosporangium saharense TaxID=1706840 RepID=A0A7W7QW48_9ACTN|nr:Pycsar system effector family protein [Streptosporangium saharense]MBB4920890.1 hypothetical protein [Streptosporangium saharense]